MIPNLHLQDDTIAWTQVLKNTTISLADLLAFVELKPSDFSVALLSSPAFKIKATADFLHKIDKGNPNDPLLLQILPFEYENNSSPGFSKDPVGDLNASLSPALIKKYAHRALLLTTQVCPIHCRYCFRQHFPYQEHSHLEHALKALAKDPSISEIILSGGDPLSLSNKKLAALFEQLEKIPHLKILRIHTRYLSLLPARFDAELIALFKNSRFTLVLVTHINHAQEIDPKVAVAIKPLKGHVTLLNQSVLLKNINDSAQVLQNLSYALLELGVLPYYLHALDKTQGVAHFEVSTQKAKEIIASMKIALPGYLVPKLVQEIEGEAHKIELN